MPDIEPTAIAGEQETEQTAAEVKAFEAITSQEDFDRAIQKRIARERAGFADYDDLKAKADRLAEIEAANQTEAEKVQARLDAAEKRATDLERDNAELATAKLRSDVAASKGVPVALLTGSTQEELEAAADALIEFRGEQKAPAPKSSALGRVNQQESAPVVTSPGIGTLRAAYGN